MQINVDCLLQVLRTGLKNAFAGTPLIKMLIDMHNSKMESVKEAVKNSKAIALTSVLWTYLGNESYCGIIGSWITDNWNSISVVLEFVHFVKRHYSTTFAELHKQFAKGWRITKKIQVLVTDNAQNMVPTVNQTGFAHSQKLSIFHGFTAADTEVLFAKCQTIKGNLKHSPFATTNFRIVVIHHCVNYSNVLQQQGTVLL